jgi:hypothetical protein
MIFGFFLLFVVTTSMSYTSMSKVKSSIFELGDTDRHQAPLHSHLIDLPQQLLHPAAEDVVQGSADEDESPVLLGGRLQSGSHIDVRTQIGGVDFEVGPDGSLYGPAEVESEAQLDLVAWQSGGDFLPQTDLGEGG